MKNPDPSEAVLTLDCLLDENLRGNAVPYCIHLPLGACRIVEHERGNLGTQAQPYREKTEDRAAKPRDPHDDHGRGCSE
jgi:hypothetical protein